MKVLLVNPNYRKVYKYVSEEATMILPPTGLAYIASYLRENNIKVEILDLAAENLDDKKAIIQITKINPDVIGIYASTNLIEEAYNIANFCKKKNNLIVVGGPHPSLFPRKTLEECKNIDIACFGEGEEVMLEIAKGKRLNKINGIAHRSKGKIKINKRREFLKNLDKLPFPALDLLPMEKYYSVGIRRYPFAPIVTSRGCPFNCNFCVNYTCLGKEFRRRSAENVLAEIDYLVKNFNVKEITIQDDNFTLDRERVEKICDGLTRRNYNLIWKTANGIRVDIVDEELIKKMKKAGCYLLAFGIESGNERILKNINKGINLKQVEKVIRWCKKYKILTEGFFMIGNEGEDENTIKDTINFAKKLDLDIAQFQVFIPFPGSSYYNKIVKEGKLFAKRWNDYNAFTEPIFEHGKLTRELMKIMQKKAYKEYYLRPKMIIKKILEIRSLTQFKAYANAGLAVLKFGK